MKDCTTINRHGVQCFLLADRTLHTESFATIQQFRLEDVKMTFRKGLHHQRSSWLLVRWLNAADMESMELIFFRARPVNVAPGYPEQTSSKSPPFYSFFFLNLPFSLTSRDLVLPCLKLSKRSPSILCYSHAAHDWKEIK